MRIIQLVAAGAVGWLMVDVYRVVEPNLFWMLVAALLVWIGSTVIVVRGES